MGGWGGVLGSRLCCQRKLNSCSLMEGSFFVYFKLFEMMNTMPIQSQSRKAILLEKKQGRPHNAFGKQRSACLAADCLKMFVQSAHRWRAC